MSFAMIARRLLALLVTVAALVAGGSQIASAAAATPLGKIESVQDTAFSNSVVITGWALDPAAKNKATSVVIMVDGKNLGTWRTAALLRTDVNKTYSATGGHGFAVELSVPVGRHTVCVSDRAVAVASSTTSLGCFAFQGYAAATKAQMLAIAATIDPHHTITWSWTALPTGSSGRSEPWDKTIQISASDTTRYLRAIMIHEWSHVLQYRAFAGTDPWGDAVQAFNALLGDPTDRQNYDGVEHGADCIAQALGATYLGYGCPAALRTYGTLIAHGVSMGKAIGNVDSAHRSGTSVTLAGWALDPSRPTTGASVQVTDNGQPLTGWTTTTVARADINTAHGVTGRHGFQVTAQLHAGANRLCITIAGANGKAAVALPTCITITV